MAQWILSLKPYYTKTQPNNQNNSDLKSRKGHLMVRNCLSQTKNHTKPESLTFFLWLSHLENVTLNCIRSILFHLLVPALLIFNNALANDPDIIHDYISPQNYSVNGTFFTYTGFRGVLDQIPVSFKATKVTVVEFPALNGQSISYALFQYPAGSLNPPHIHPRAVELLFLVSGSLQVGFVDTTRTLYTQNLQPGDVFIFPKGLIHYQYNPESISATAISAFGSANAGTVSIPHSIFSTGIDDVILAKAFKIDAYTVKKIRLGLNKP